MAKTSLAKKLTPHDANCACDECIKARVRARVAAAPAAAPVAVVDETRPLTVDDLPFRALTWFLIVEPRMPKDRIGKMGLYVSQETKNVEEIQTTVGHVVHKGAQFGEGRSASGLRMNDDPEFASIKAGDYVLFGRYTGQQVKIRVGTGVRRVIVLTDTELMLKVSEPDRIQFWV